MTDAPIAPPVSAAKVAKDYAGHVPEMPALSLVGATTVLTDLADDAEINILEYITVMVNTDRAVGIDSTRDSSSIDIAEHMTHFSMHTREHHAYTFEFNELGQLVVSWNRYPVDFWVQFGIDILLGIATGGLGLDQIPFKY